MMLLACVIGGINVNIMKLGDDLLCAYQGVWNFYQDTHLKAQTQRWYKHIFLYDLPYSIKINKKIFHRYGYETTVNAL
jgi:hypothetical protein